MRSTTSALLLASALLITAGCNGSDEDKPPTSKADSSSLSSASPSVVVEPSGAAVPQLADPVGEREIVSKGWKLKLEMFPLQRSSEGMVLNARLSYLDAGADQYPPADVLASDGAFSRATGRPNGFSLVDKAGGKVYLPAKDANDESLCSPGLRSGLVQVDDQVYVSCVFGAPSESTTTVDVRAASFGVFSNVPIQ